jgi:hypothetical protein
MSECRMRRHGRGVEPSPLRPPCLPLVSLVPLVPLVPLVSLLPLPLMPLVRPVVCALACCAPCFLLVPLLHGPVGRRLLPPPPCNAPPTMRAPLPAPAPARLSGGGGLSPTCACA